MKFGKSLSNQIEETLPEWRDKFLSYKELKKCLKGIPPQPPSSSSSSTSFSCDVGGGGERGRPWKRQRAEGGDAVRPPASSLSLSSSSSSCSSSSPPPAGGLGMGIGMEEEEAEFIRLLEAELDKFNTFFVEKEEEYVIRLKDLQDRMIVSNDSKDEMMKIRKEIVDFHGEMVLLENYSALNYTGLVKILKKYDKRTGTLLRLPFIQKVLQEPFFTTDLLYKLVKECETMLDSLFPAKELASTEVNGVTNLNGEKQHVNQEVEPSSLSNSGIPDLETIKYMESLYMKSTVAALRVLKEIRKGSSTVSVFSLPPLHSTDGVEERWGKVPVVEQEAK